jgi:hypothetical protein
MPIVLPTQEAELRRIGLAEWFKKSACLASIGLEDRGWKPDPGK